MLKNDKQIKFTQNQEGIFSQYLDTCAAVHGVQSQTRHLATEQQQQGYMYL